MTRRYTPPKVEAMASDPGFMNGWPHASRQAQLPARSTTEATCEHGYLPGGMGCAVCESNALAARMRNLAGCRCQFDNWGRFLGAHGCPKHGPTAQRRGRSD